MVSTKILVLTYHHQNYINVPLMKKRNLIPEMIPLARDLTIIICISIRNKDFNTINKNFKKFKVEKNKYITDATMVLPIIWETVWYYAK